MTIRVLVIATLTLLAPAGCGGQSRRAYPLYVPSMTMVAADAATLKHQTRMPPEGLIAPVGIRTFGNTVIVVDVLVAIPTTLNPELPRRAIFQSVFNALGVFDASDGKGFELRRADGHPLGLGGFDLGNPPSDVARASFSLLPSLEVRDSRAAAADVEFDVAMLPIVVRCSEDVPVGATTCARLTTDRTFLGLAVSRDEVCARAVAMPTAPLTR